MSIGENIKHVTARRNAAAERSGRAGDDVLLVAVTKLHSAEEINEAIDCGITDIGENKVQEMMDKIPVLPKDIRWHMIGHLQRNKVKYVVGQAALIHSVDTYRLAEEINIQAKKKGICMPVLIEVNIAGEASKFGVRPEDTLQLVKDISTLENVKIQGLMTVAPYVEDPEENRGCFRKIKDLSVDIAAQNIDNVSMNILSMGMTGDYETACEEGSTFVRVGTGIFGERSWQI